MDPNRLHLNFGAPGYNNDRTYQASNERVYPTTPSTFPQPVFQPQPGQVTNEYLGAQLQSPVAAAYGGGAGYFPNSQYQQSYGQQQQNQYSSQYQQANLQSPQLSYPQRQGPFNGNDPTTGLAHQFSNQNLGANQRQGSPFGRQPSPSQRPRTGGGGAPQSYGNHLTPSMPANSTTSQHNSADEPPEKNPEKYSSNIAKRGAGLHAFVEGFFMESINRAKERNQR